jgi:hypothetical protein
MKRSSLFTAVAVGVIVGAAAARWSARALAQCATINQVNCNVASSCGHQCEPCGTKVVVNSYPKCLLNGSSGYKNCTAPFSVKCETIWQCGIDDTDVCGVQNGDPNQPLYACTGKSGNGVDQDATDASSVDLDSPPCGQGSGAN